MYFLVFGREIRRTHIVFCNKRFLIDHLEYTLSGPKSNLFYNINISFKYTFAIQFLCSKYI